MLTLDVAGLLSGAKGWLATCACALFAMSLTLYMVTDESTQSTVQHSNGHYYHLRDTIGQEGARHRLHVLQTIPLACQLQTPPPQQQQQQHSTYI